MKLLDQFLVDFAKETHPGDGLMPQFLAWMGGKAAVAKKIVSYLPQHEAYIEVFAGSAAVFFNKPRSPVEVINDINDELIDMYRVVRDEGLSVIRAVGWMPYARSLFQEAMQIYQSSKFAEIDRISRAIIFIYIHKIMFNKYSPHFSAGHKVCLDYNMNLMKRLWKSRLRLDNVMIECLKFDDLIKKYDKGDNTVFYCDPPYYVTLKKKEYYKFKFEQRHHDKLAEMLKNLNSKFLLSYDDVPEIRKMYDWAIFNKLRFTYTSSTVQDGEGQAKEELLISNYELPKQEELFK